MSSNPSPHSWMPRGQLVNSVIGESVHYIITGRHSNIGLPKLHRQEFANDNPAVYDMQINALLKQVHTPRRLSRLQT